MQKHIPKPNPNDSILSEELPDYSKGYFPSIVQSGSSASFSLNNMEKKINPFKDSVLEKSYDKFQQFKKDFYKERNLLVQKFNLKKYNREVIKSFINNDELQLQIKQEKKKKNRIQEQNQMIKQQNQRVKIQNDKKIRQRQAYEQFDQFKLKLKQKFNQQRFRFKNQQQINEELTKILSQNLKKRSQLTLNKLKPYLEHSIKDLKQNNQILEDNNQFLTSQKSKYDKQVEVLRNKTLQQNQMKKKFEQEDKFQDQYHLEQQINNYQQRIKKDVQMQKKKVLAL